MLWPDHCVHRSQGAELHTLIQQALMQLPSPSPSELLSACASRSQQGSPGPDGTTSGPDRKEESDKSPTPTPTPTTAQKPLVVDLPKGQLVHEDFYSAFASVGYTAFTPLVRLLSRANIERLVVCGLATDYCVRSTALDARKFGFDTIVALEAVRGVNPESSQRALELVRSAGGRVLHVRNILQEVAGAAE